MWGHANAAPPSNSSQRSSGSVGQGEVLAAAVEPAAGKPRSPLQGVNFSETSQGLGSKVWWALYVLSF